MVMFTWLIFIINPFIGMIFVVLGLYKDRKKSTHYSLMFALFFAALAYWFIPNHEMDLTRYFLQLSIYKNLSWSNFITVILPRNTLFIQEIMFFLISKTNNFHLLPAIVIFITYFLTFYMITNYSNRKSIESKKMMGIIFFIVCVLPFPSLVSNIRNILAFVLFIYAVYRDLEEKKRNFLTYSLYLIPIFIHISAVALLIARLLLPVYNKSNRKAIIAGVIMSTTFLTGIVSNFIQNSFLGDNRIISAFFNKANNYVNNTESGYAQYLEKSLVMNLQKAYFVGVVVLILATIIMINRYSKSYFKDNKDITTKEFRKINSFISLICFIVIGTAPIVLTVYLRFVFPVIILSFIVIIEKDIIVKNKLLNQLFSIGIFIAIMGGLLNQIAFTYKMTNIANMITSVMVRSLLNMFFM